jgi:hypothetical protein
MPRSSGEALARLWATGGFLSPMGELVGAGALMLAGCPEDSPILAKFRAGSVQPAF